MMLLYRSVFPFVCFSLFSLLLLGQPSLSISEWAEGFNSPVDIVHAGDDRLFIVEQSGRIQILLSNGTTPGQPFLDISNKVNTSSNERGLLGLVFHPDYVSNGQFFIHYTISNGASRIARYKVSADDENLANADSELVILEQAQPFNNHNGGDLEFGPDGYLYVAFGDGGSAGDPNGNAQNGQTWLGKLLRIDVNEASEAEPYRIPEDNPFVNDSQVKDEIWALGLRNPWRFSFDQLTGDLWIGDVGQNEFEEINFATASSTGGENYGWRCWEGLATYNTADCPGADDFSMPAYAYAHRTFGCSGSVTGGEVYRGSQYPGLYGNYIYADYCTGKISALVPNQFDEGFTNYDLLTINNNEVSTIGAGANGELFFAAIRTGKIYKIQGATTTPTQEYRIWNKVKLAPNPVKDVLRVSVTAGKQNGPEISWLIRDATGSIMQQNTGEMQANWNTQIDFSSLPAGMYFFQILSEKQSGVWKVVKSQ